MPTITNTLLAEVLAVHGGLDRWRNFNLFGCDSPKLASSRFRVIFLLIPRSLLRGSLHLTNAACCVVKTTRLILRERLVRLI